MATRNSETAEQNASAWARTALALGGATPWEWARRVAYGEAKRDAVPRQYEAIVDRYLAIKKELESLL